MRGTIKVWNITPVTQDSPRPVSLYGVTIQPDGYALIKERDIDQYIEVLRDALQGGLIYVGKSLPSWYGIAKETAMKELTNKGPEDTVLATDSFSPTLIESGATIPVTDEQAEDLAGELKQKPWVVITGGSSEGESSHEGDVKPPEDTDPSEGDTKPPEVDTKLPEDTAPPEGADVATKDAKSEKKVSKKTAAKKTTKGKTAKKKS